MSAFLVHDEPCEKAVPCLSRTPWPMSCTGCRGDGTRLDLDALVPVEQYDTGFPDEKLWREI